MPNNDDIKKSVTTAKDKKNSSLQKVVEGTSIVFFGLLLAMFLNFLSRLLIARNWTESEFGIFSLGFSILSICTVLSTLGLKQGLSRNIAFNKGKKNFKKIRRFITSSIYISLSASIIIGVIVFLLSESIAIKLFNEPALVTPLRIVSFGIPIFALMEIIISIYQGFSQVKETVVYERIIFNIALISLISLIIFLTKPFYYVFYGLVASLFVGFILLVFHSRKRIKTVNLLNIKSVFSSASKELMIFSLPLLGTAVLQLITSWTDTLMLGGIKTSADVGFYNVSQMLAQFIAFPLSALIIIFVPVFSGLYAKNKIDEMKIDFSIITKWISSITLPIFFFIFIFPEESLMFLYGSDYIFASDALRILSMGYLIQNFSGPCGVTLVTVGRSRFIMFATLASASLNIILNTAFIPYYGIIGAAFATIFSLILINIIKNIKLYSITGIHPISKNLIKSTFAFLILIVPIYIYSKNILELSFPLLTILLIASYVLYLLVYLLTRSLDKEDIHLLNLIEKSTGLKMKKIKEFFNKFT